MSRAAVALGVLLVLLVTAAAPGMAGAQEAGGAQEEYDPGLVRSGTVFEVRGGWGTFLAPACGDCTGRYYARSFAMHIGGMIGTRMALLGGFDLGLQDGRSILSLDLISRWFLGEQMWADAGIGAATLTFTERGQNGSAEFNGMSLHLAAGYDLYESRSFALEASLRAVIAHSSADSNDSIQRNDAAVSFQLGATWY